MKDGIIGVVGGAATTLASAGARNEVSAWVSLICTLAITVVTCGIQIWRMIRDRNADKNKSNDKNEDEKENKQ